jgi:excisionase family DNA binding protein
MSTNNAYLKPLWISRAQAAALLSCRPGTISKLIKQGLLPATTLGYSRTIRIRLIDVETMMQKQGRRQ